MVGIVDVEAAPMLGADGEPITARGWYDTESIAVDGPTVYIGLERVHQILKFDFGRDGVRARGEPIPQPPGMRKLPSNGGLEALVMVRKDRFKSSPLAGMLLAISERGLDSAGNIRGLDHRRQGAGELLGSPHQNYDISDAALLPSGDLLLLERKFSLFGDTGVRIRRIPLASIVPDAVIDGPTIFDADLGYEIDNIEGSMCMSRPEGDTVLTLISDDNFSMLQRTLLMQFTLVE